jgi:septal ring factor EnvC (AmiA/AmiB activator)
MAQYKEQLEETEKELATVRKHSDEIHRHEEELATTLAKLDSSKVRALDQSRLEIESLKEELEASDEALMASRLREEASSQSLVDAQRDLESEREQRQAAEAARSAMALREAEQRERAQKDPAVEAPVYVGPSPEPVLQSAVDVSSAEIQEIEPAFAQKKETEPVNVERVEMMKTLQRFLSRDT